METIQLSKIHKPDYRKYYCSEALESNAYGTKAERAAIAMSIETTGQLEPIVLWKKRGTVHLIDGRNRVDGCAAAGVKELNCVYLPTNTTKAELQVYIDQTRTRVNTDVTQKTIEAYRRTQLTGDDKLTQVQAAEKFAVSKQNIKHAAYIDKSQPKLLVLLFGSSEYMYTRSGGKTTRALSTIRKEVEMIDIKNRQQGEDKEVSADAQFYSQMHRQSDDIVHMMEVYGKGLGWDTLGALAFLEEKVSKRIAELSVELDVEECNPELTEEVREGLPLVVVDKMDHRLRAKYEELVSRGEIRG